MLKAARSSMFAVVSVIATWSAGLAVADWPQWRGENRDGKVQGFQAPATWPAALKQEWKVGVGNGVATPSLVSNRLYVFTREGGDEVLRCLDARNGIELWKKSYPTEASTGGAAQFPGPRASPTVADGKVVTLGVRGILSCYDATSGDLVWRKDDFAGKWPQFYAASSPIVTGGLCIAQLGGERDGGIVAYDLNSGEVRWKWTGDGPAYSSPTLADVNGTNVLVAATGSKLVGLNAADGKLLYETGFTQGRYNTATPIVEGQTIFYPAQPSGLTAATLEKKGDELVATQGWKQSEASLRFNTPVLRDGYLYGISGLNALFCVNASTGDLAWSAPIGQSDAAAGAAKGEGKSDTPPPGDQPGGGKGKGGKGGKGRGGMRGGGGGGYGSVVDAGSVLVALNPTGQLVVFEPSGAEFRQVAQYKVADDGTYAYPVLSGNRIYIKDADSLAAWAIE